MTMLTSLKALFSSATPVAGAQPLPADGSGFAAFLKAFTQQAAPDAPLPTPSADPLVASDGNAAVAAAGLPAVETASLPATPLDTADALIDREMAHDLPQPPIAHAADAVAELPAAPKGQETAELFDGTAPALEPSPIEGPRIASRAHKSDASSSVEHAAEPTASSLGVIDDEADIDGAEKSPELKDQDDGASYTGQSVQASIVPGASAAPAPLLSAPAPGPARNDMLQVASDAPASAVSGVRVAAPVMPQPHANGDRSALPAYAQVIADTAPELKPSAEQASKVSPTQDRPDMAPAIAPAIDQGPNPGLEPSPDAPVAAGETPFGDVRPVTGATQTSKLAAAVPEPAANTEVMAKDGAVEPERSSAAPLLGTPDGPVGKAAMPAVGSNPVMQDAVPRVAAPQIANAQIASPERGAPQAAIPVATANPAVVDQAPGIQTLQKLADPAPAVASLNSPEPTTKLELDQPSSGPLLSQPPELRPRRSIGEALSLLQMAREHLHGRSSDVGRNDASLRQDLAAVAAPQPSIDPVASVTPAVVSPTPATPSALPTVDLAASLGARVVDLGVSGQWIDGLAREIASVSANGAHGRFQLNAGLLGDVQVDIRPSADGAAVSLIVASDLAEQALRQESDRLKQDASLSAIRISDVRVERAPVTEPSRNDGAGGQSFSQSQGGAGAPSHGQQQGRQPSAEPNMQGRGQSRENFPGGHKAGAGAAVLNHERSGVDATDLPRARYA